MTDKVVKEEKINKGVDHLAPPVLVFSDKN